MSKSLVAYFSASGVTKKVAERLNEVVQGNLFEIVPQQPYTSADVYKRQVLSVSVTAVVLYTLSGNFHSSLCCEQLSHSCCLAVVHVLILHVGSLVDQKS